LFETSPQKWEDGYIRNGGVRPYCGYNNTMVFVTSANTYRAIHSRSLMTKVFELSKNNYSNVSPTTNAKNSFSASDSNTPDLGTEMEESTYKSVTGVDEAMSDEEFIARQLQLINQMVQK